MVVKKVPDVELLPSTKITIACSSIQIVERGGQIVGSKLNSGALPKFPSKIPGHISC